MTFSPSMLPAALASVYVGDLHRDITCGQLYVAFSEFKSLASVRVCRQSSTGLSLGYGYLHFSSPEEAIEAVEAKNHFAIKGKKIRLKSVPSTDQKTLLVGGLHRDVTDLQLFNAFSEFNSVTAVRVCRDYSTGRSHGYGFVNLASAEDAFHAIKIKNNSILNGKAIMVSALDDEDQSQDREDEETRHSQQIEEVKKKKKKKDKLLFNIVDDDDELLAFF